MTGLSAGTSYFVRAFATNALGPAYSGNISIAPNFVDAANGNYRLAASADTCGSHIVWSVPSELDSRITGAPRPAPLWSASRWNPPRSILTRMKSPPACSATS